MRVENLTATSTQVHFSRATNRSSAEVVSVGISTPDEIVHADNTGALRVHLAVDNAAVYWVLGSSFATKSEIRRCALTGTDCTTIANVDGAVRRFLIVGDEFYYDSNVRFYRLKKTGGTPAEVYSPPYADKLTGNSSNLYWSQTTSRVSTIPNDYTRLLDTSAQSSTN